MGPRAELSEFRLGRLLKASWRRGRNGSGVWFGLATVLTTLRFMRHLSRKKQRAVFRQELQPGESLRIDHLLRDTDGRS